MPGFGLSCPHCMHHQVFRSRSAVGWLARLVFLHRVRCGHCNRRSWVVSFRSPPSRS